MVKTKHASRGRPQGGWLALQSMAIQNEAYHLAKHLVWACGEQNIESAST